MTTSIDQFGNASIEVTNAAQVPSTSGATYSLGKSTIFTQTKRTGGEGAYGTVLAA